MKKITSLFVLTPFIVTVIISAVGCRESIQTTTPPSTSTSSSATQMPTTANAYYEKGKLLAQSGDWDGVIENCSKAISLNPDSSEAYYVRGLGQIVKKRYDAAIIDLNMAANMETTKSELAELKKVTNLVIQPGELILLHMDLTYGGGSDCRGNYMPYNNTIQLQLLVNPGDSAVEINKIYLNPPLEGKGELTSPVRYFDTLGLQYLVTCLSSANPPIISPAVKVEFKPKSSLIFKKSNEISAAQVTEDPANLICPTN